MQNLYDLIIIRENVVPQEHIEELMLLTNSDDTAQATVFKEQTEGKSIDRKEDKGREDLKIRNTLWYPIPDEQGAKFESGIYQAYFSFLLYEN